MLFSAFDRLWISYYFHIKLPCFGGCILHFRHTNEPCFFTSASSDQTMLFHIQLERFCWSITVKPKCQHEKVNFKSLSQPHPNPLMLQYQLDFRQETSQFFLISCILNHSKYSAIASALACYLSSVPYSIIYPKIEKLLYNSSSCSKSRQRKAIPKGWVEEDLLQSIALTSTI